MSIVSSSRQSILFVLSAENKQQDSYGDADMKYVLLYHPTIAVVTAACLVKTAFTYNVIVGQVLDDHKRNGFIEVANIPIPVQFSCWPQLLLSQILLPQANVSFTGHLCGIFAGLLHVFLPKAGTAYTVYCLWCACCML